MNTPTVNIDRSQVRSPSKLPTLQATCRFCGAAGPHPAMQAAERMFDSRALFTYFECTSCGSALIENQPDDLGRHYPEHYYSYSGDISISPPAKGLRQWAQRRRSETLCGVASLAGSLIRSVLPDASELHWEWFKGSGVTPASRILDVGCGQGKLLRQLHKVGFDRLYGADPFLQKTVVGDGLNLINRPLAEVHGAFDLIMFHHSLEHIFEPVEALVQARERLTPRGRVLVRVPVAGCFAWREYGVDWVQLDAPRHLSVPSVKGMEAVARRAGLQVTSVAFDSDGFQLWGSELYRRGLPLVRPGQSTQALMKQTFTAQELEAFAERARALNASSDGDQACFYLSRA